MITYIQKQEEQLAKLKSFLKENKDGIELKAAELYSQEILYLSLHAVRKRLELWENRGFIKFEKDKIIWVE